MIWLKSHTVIILVFIDCSSRTFVSPEKERVRVILFVSVTASGEACLIAISCSDAGYMWEAQLLGSIKGALPAIGAAVGSIFPVIGTAVGAAIGSAIASTIHVDAKTGKRSYQTTDATGVGLVVSAATWGAGAYLTGTMQAVTQYSITAASGGVKYDENGKIAGGFDPVAAGISVAAKAAGQYGGGAFGGGQVGSFLASDITSTVLNTGVQYHNYSHGYQNNYAALASPDLTRLGALGGGLLGAAYTDSRTAEASAIAKNGASKGMTPEQIEAAMRDEGLYEEADNYMKNVEGLKAAREAQNRGQQEQAVQILLGLGYRREQINEMIPQMDDGYQAARDAHFDRLAKDVANAERPAISPRYQQAIQAAHYDYLSVMRDYIENNPGATEAEIKAYGEKIQKVFMSDMYLKQVLNQKPGVSKADLGKKIMFQGEEMLVRFIIGNRAILASRNGATYSVDISGTLYPLTTGGQALRSIDIITERQAKSMEFWKGRSLSLDMPRGGEEYREAIKTELQAQQNYEIDTVITNLNRRFTNERVGTSGEALGWLAGGASFFDGGLLSRPVGSFITGAYSNSQTDGMSWDQRYAFNAAYQRNFDRGYQNGERMAMAATVAATALGAAGLAKAGFTALASRLAARVAAREAAIAARMAAQDVAAVTKSGPETISLFRKMSTAEAEATLRLQKLQPRVSGTNSNKYLSESLEKVQAFQNKGFTSTEHTVLEFQLDARKYSELRSTMIPQQGSKGSGSIIYNFEGLEGTNLYNIGVPDKHLETFNSLIRLIKELQ